jgi:DNA polymerase-3 subunit alpha
LASGLSAQKDRASGQVSLFGESDLTPSNKVARDNVDFTPWTISEKLGYEKELLGFYVTGHPLDPYRDLIEGGRFQPISALVDLEDKSTVRVAGSISAFEKKFTRREGKPFAILTIEDFTGAIEVMVWNDVFAKSGKEIDKGKIVSIAARLDKREDTARLIATEIGGISQRKALKPLVVDIPFEKADESRLLALRDLIRQHPGTQPLFLRFRAPDGRELRLKTDPGYSVTDNEGFREKLAELLL